MRYLLTVICGLLILSGCKHDSEEPEALLDRVVIMYAIGDNNLTNNVERNMTDFAQASTGLGNNKKIVMLIDNNDTTPMQVVISNGKKESMTIFDDEFYMTSPSMMKTLLSSVMNEYKAKSYGIILWGHSTGWLVEPDTLKTRGVGYDNNGGTSSTGNIWINFPTLAEVFESLPSKFDFILGDCCLLQCVEVAYELKDCCNYIIGSPAEAPADGFPYSKIVSYMFDGTVEAYCRIADLVNQNANTKYGATYITPTSVIRTSALNDLATATNKLITGGKLPYPVNVDQAIYYFKTNGQPIMYDMNNILLNNLETDSYFSWKKAFDQVVIDKYKSSMWATSFSWPSSFSVNDDNYGGMSMFFPMEIYNYNKNYYPNEKIKNMKWYMAAGLDKYAK